MIEGGAGLEAALVPREGGHFPVLVLSERASGGMVVARYPDPD